MKKKEDQKKKKQKNSFKIFIYLFQYLHTQRGWGSNTRPRAQESHVLPTEPARHSRKRLIDTENKLVVARGEVGGVGGWGKKGT